MIYVLVIIIFILLAGIYCYLCKSISKISFISKIKSKLLKWIVGTLIVCLPLLFFSITNTIVILFHMFIFLLLINLFFNLIEVFMNKGKRKKENTISYNTRFCTGLIVTIIYLCIGAYFAFNVWETNYKIVSNKILGTNNFRIVQFADSHVGTTFDGNGLKKHIEKMNKTNPDIVVITGDFIDDETTKEDMINACAALSLLQTNYGVYYVNGNHDKGYYNSRGYSYEDLVTELKKNNVKVLEDEVVNITEHIVLIGRMDKTNSERKDIDVLSKDIDKSRYIIVLNHQPNDYTNENKAGVDLVLSGHTHGGQLIPLGPIGILSGANDATYGLTTKGGTNYIVTSGISDWELYFKTGTKSEYVVIDVMNKG